VCDVNDGVNVMVCRIDVLRVSFCHRRICCVSMADMLIVIVMLLGHDDDDDVCGG